MKRLLKNFYAIFSEDGYMLLRSPIMGMNRQYDEDAVAEVLRNGHRIESVVIVSYDKLREKFTDEEIDDLCQAPLIND